MTKYINYVKALYLKSWDEAKAEALVIVPLEEASNIVNELSCSQGWRERVVAANIISAFELHTLAPALIKTFSENPESYTCSAFSLLVRELPKVDQSELTKYMLSYCPDGSYGDYLRSTISEVASNAV
ncbi:hypothetical protein CN03_07375 [Thalassolituus oleivorans]|uniref:hypothetical protein n=1 Tax=Thalassolituus oleivorans TaxID=187493 RepID=UPI0009492527|nr:hypothetical protein [Thalassolituus oleivorans]APR66774.1 hypothetical protein CN03_07375 [Thalassolituus oleivorans]